MKVRNKKSGEVFDFGYLQTDHISPIVLTVYKDGQPIMRTYGSLSEMMGEWEDVPDEEPKEYWFIDTYEGTIVERTIECFEMTDKERKEIGNYFDTREEAERAVEKLKAVKRLKDNGFKFTAYQLRELNIKFFLDHGYTEMVDDLDLLFGGEE